MSIYTKIGILLFCAVVGIAAAGIFAQYQVTLPGFLAIERENAVQDIQRVSAAIDNQIEYLDSTCLDWASWDDTYDFIFSADAGYVEANLQIDTFENNHLNLIYFCDVDGRVVWGELRDTATDELLSVRQFPANALPHTHPLFLLNPEGGKGIFITERGPMLVAARPILKSNHDGPARGILIMGRLIDEDLIEDLIRRTHVDHRIQVINKKPLTPSAKDIIDRISPDVPYLITEADSKKLMVYSVLSDITGKPGLLLSLSFPREISSTGYKTIRIGIYLIILASIAFFLLVLVSLKRLVIKPMEHLTAHALAVRRNCDYSVRLGMNRHDEIGILAKEFDALLANIDRTTQTLKQANQKLEENMALQIETVKALRESEQRFRSMLDQAVDAMFLVDLDARIRMVNRVACERLGYDRHELLKMTVPDIDPDFENRGDKEKIWMHMEETMPVLFEARHRRKDNTIFPIEISLSPFEYQDETLILAIARDITERKQLENRLRYTHKMEAVRTLTGGIAHNFNNILAVIMGSTELVAQSIPKDHPAGAKLKSIEAAVARARDIVWQLIHFSHQATEESKPIDIKKAVIDVVEAKRPSTPANITIHTLIEDECALVHINPAQIRLIVSNLWENAVEAMTDQGGRLEVRVENVLLEKPLPDMDPDLKPGHYLCLTVVDTGRGIDPALIGSIFDPYFTTKDFACGAGMGLAIVHGIVVGNGGGVSVTSTPGRGTRVRIYFPAAVSASLLASG